MLIWYFLYAFQMICFLMFLFGSGMFALLFGQVVIFLFRNHFLPFSGDWKDLEFKDYNYEAQGQPIAKGYVQPLMEVSPTVSAIYHTTFLVN